MYELHYIERIRPEAHSAALVFGNALDVALNEMLMPTGKSPEEVFEKAFRVSEIATKDCYIPTYTKLVYPNANFDSEILISEDFEEVYKFITEGTIKVEGSFETSDGQLAFYNEIKKRKDTLNEEEKKYYNFVNWLSAYRRGLLMLIAYRKHVLPYIEEVISSQEKINLENQDGDIIRGVVDLVARVKGHDTPIILDNKTSSMRYKDDAVKESEQLGLYVHALEDKYNTRTAGFIVLNKQIKKNRVKICKTCGHRGDRAKTCDAIGSVIVNGKHKEGRCGGEWEETIAPEIVVQILIDTIQEKLQHKVIDVFDEVNLKIKAGVFEKNFKSCDNQFGQPCPYRSLCHENSMCGLIDLNKDENGKKK